MGKEIPSFVSENGTVWLWIKGHNYPGYSHCQHTNGPADVWFKKVDDKNWKVFNKHRGHDALVKWYDLIEGYADYEIEHFLDEVRYD